SSPELAVIPLFLLMGAFAGSAGLSADVYRFAEAFIGHRRGGLAMATVAGCGGFGAVCGSSIATTVTMARIALPEMEKRNYSPSLGAGAIAAGGTLGTLIPPSIIMVLYAALTEQFVIKLFVAAIIPGVITIALYFAAVAVYVRVRPSAAPPGPKMPWRQRLQVASQTWGILVIITAVTGGIYGGIFTVTEAAAVGVGLTLAFAWARGKMRGESFWQALFETAANVGMLYLILIGARIFTYFITLTHVPSAFVEAITALNLAPLAVVFLLVAMYIFLGAVFDAVAAMVLTLPFVFPLIIGMGLDPIWWGVVMVIVIEIGLITPPIGINVFAMHSVRPDIPLPTIFRGIVPFLGADIIRLALVILIPGLALWLPSTM
ncbi:MAG: TRAP transporter large permease, partial [Alphaproteobacteria bacterium]